jgi:competence protein ComEC
VLHLVAISGFNLAVMAGALMFVLRLTGDRGWIEPLAVALLVALYMLVLPAQAPILRAGILVLVLLATESLGRRYDRAAVLGWIALALLVFRPLDAWSMGFQLSFGIVGALLLLGDTVHHRLWGVPLRGLAPTHQPHGRPAWWAWMPPLWRWTAGSFKGQISAGLLAWAVSIPIIACHTGQFSPLAPIATLIVLPLTVVVLWGGYLALLIGVLVPSASSYTGPALDRIASFLVNVVMTLDRAPGTSFTLPAISPWWAMCAVAGVVFLIVRGGRKDRRSWALCAVLAAWLALELLLVPRLTNRAAVRIDTLAVGDGSCHLLRSGSDAALWDCGSLTPGLGQRTIPRALRALGVWKVPTVVVTHAHLDHFAAIPDLIEPLGITRVIVPPQLIEAARSDPGGAPAVLLAHLAERNVQVETRARGDRLALAGLSADIHWPPAAQTFRDPNDHSLVAMLEVPTAGSTRRVLLTGDAAREALANLLPDQPAAAAGLRADILELPHHGAFIDPAVALVHAVNPSHVLQSTGPRRAADKRWDPHMDGRTRYCTPISGAAWIAIDPDGSIRSGSVRR